MGVDRCIPTRTTEHWVHDSPKSERKETKHKKRGGAWMYCVCVCDTLSSDVSEERGGWLHLGEDVGDRNSFSFFLSLPFPLDAHAGVLIDAAGVLEEGLDLWEFVQTSRRARTHRAAQRTPNRRQQQQQPAPHRGGRMFRNGALQNKGEYYYSPLK